MTMELDMREDLRYAERLLQDGELSKAIEVLHGVLFEQPDNAHALRCIGIAFTESGENQKALRALDYSIRLDPEAAEAHEAVGCAYLRLEQPNQALTALNRAHALDPENGSILRNLSVLYSQLGDQDESYRLLCESFRRNRHDYLTLYALAHAKLTRKQLSEATELLKELLQYEIPEHIRELAERQLEELERSSNRSA